MKLYLDDWKTRLLEDAAQDGGDVEGSVAELTTALSLADLGFVTELPRQPTDDGRRFATTDSGLVALEASRKERRQP